MPLIFQLWQICTVPIQRRKLVDKHTVRLWVFTVVFPFLFLQACSENISKPKSTTNSESHSEKTTPVANVELLDALLGDEIPDFVRAKQALDGGADINSKLLGRTYLLTMVRRGKVEGVKFVLKNGADVNGRSSFGRTPLHEAALYGFLDIAKVLLNAGADVNATNPRGETPLFYATNGLPFGPKHNKKHDQVVELLQAHGADVNFQDRAGDTALDLTQNKEIAQLLGSGGGAAASPDDIVALGKEMWEIQECYVCHKLFGEGGKKRGPTMDNIGNLMTAEALREKILNPKSWMAEGFDKQYKKGEMSDVYRDLMLEEEIDALVAFLSTLKDASVNTPKPIKMK
jgi:hypothetical protein